MAATCRVRGATDGASAANRFIEQMMPQAFIEAGGEALERLVGMAATVSISGPSYGPTFAPPSC